MNRHATPSQFAAFAFACRTGGRRRLYDAILDVLGGAAQVIERGDHAVVAVQEVGAGRDVTTVAAAARDRVALALALAPPYVSVGIVGPVQGRLGARLAAIQSEQVLRLGVATRGEGSVTTLDELGPARFVLGPTLVEVSELSDRLLSPLLEADDLSDELVLTLESYLRSQGSVKEMAHDLRVHRNTVRRRMDRIRDLTGDTLDNPDSRLTLHLALLGRRIAARLAS